MQAVEGMRETLAILIDDDVDLALAEQFDVLGAVASRALEAEALDQRDERGGIGIAGREFDEFDALDLGRRRRRAADRGAAARRGRRAPRSPVSPSARSDRMPSSAICGGRGAAELVVEDLERDRAAIARVRRSRRDIRRRDSRPGRDSSGNGGSATAGPSAAPARRRPAPARSFRPGFALIGASGLPRTQAWKLSSTMPRLGRSAARTMIPGLRSSP